MLIFAAAAAAEQFVGNSQLRHNLVKKRGTWQINNFAKSQFDYFLKFYHCVHIKILEKKGMK